MNGKVAVAYLDNEHWSASFGLSLIELLMVDMTRGTDRRVMHQLRKFAASGGIVTGRNEIARRFLDTTDCEWLLTVDSDMSFGPTTVEDLISSCEQVGALMCGALCFGVNGVGHGDFYTLESRIFPTVYDWNETDESVGFRPRLEYDRDTLQQCGATGAACTILHRSALEKVREQFGDHWYDTLAHEKAKSGGFSEDLSFCMRLAVVGVPCWVNTAVKTAHHKGQGHYLDEAAFDRQLMMLQGEGFAFFAAYSSLLPQVFGPRQPRIELVA